MYEMARRLLEGDALAAFERAVMKHGCLTKDHFEQALSDLIAHVFPKRALNNQKYYMRNVMYKLREMNIREYTTRVHEMVMYLAFSRFYTASWFLNRRRSRDY